MIESISAAREKLKTLAGARGSKGFFLTVTLSTSRLDDWRQFAPTFLNSEFNRLTKERDTPKDEKRASRTTCSGSWTCSATKCLRRRRVLPSLPTEGGGMFEQMELPLRLVNRLVIEPSPYVRPVVHALSLLEPFVVVRVSNDDSSIYLVNEWRVAQEERFHRSPPQEHRPGDAARWPSRNTTRLPAWTSWRSSITRMSRTLLPSSSRARGCAG